VFTPLSVPKMSPAATSTAMTVALSAAASRGGPVPQRTSFADGRLSEAELRELPDEEVIRRLTEVNGIGPWTVGALRIALCRPDLIRADDLALRHSIQAHYGLDHLPDATEVKDLARRWSPYRSLASSLLLAAARSS